MPQFPSLADPQPLFINYTAAMSRERLNAG